MKMYRKNRLAGWKRQKGMTLMELLVAGTISVIVSSGMIILMASTLGTGTDTIKMTRLSSEMRSSMQMMTRELRRANYHASFLSCYGDPDCLVTLNATYPGITAKITEINIGEINDPGDCVWFWYDRPQRCESPPCDAEDLLSDQDAIIDEPVAAFKRMVNGDGIGIIQMAASLATSVSCGDALTDSDWFEITNPDLIDITAFNVNDAASYQYTINGTQSIERIGLTMSGKLRSDVSLPAWMQGGGAPELTMQDFVRVRNDVFVP